MKYRTVISIIVAAMLALTSMSIYADQGKGGGGKTGNPDQDQQHTQDSMGISDKEIYGGELMSPEERDQYREQLRQMESEEERLQFQAQHREKMDARAKALEREVEEAE